MRLPLVLNQHESRSPSMTDAAPEEVAAYLPYQALVEHANEKGQVKVVFVMYRRLASLLRPRSFYHEGNGHLQPYAYQQAYVDPYEAAYHQSPYFTRHHNNQLPSSSPVMTIVNSDVVGLIIASGMHQSSYDRLSTPLSAPLELTLRHLQSENITNGRCAFWDIKRSDWSTSGCETVATNRTHTVCRCNHLTNFAVLVDVTNTKVSKHSC